MARICIGTSGWNYKHWLGPFYPEKTRAADMLDFYTRHFDTVELNNSFYHLPTVKAFDTWRESTPPDFVFAVKGSRFITHMKKLKDPGPATEKFFARADNLRQKLGPILFQLPPHWRVNVERLASFLAVLPSTHRYAFEFREPSWFTTEVYDLLKRHNSALCIYQMTGYESPREITADFIYLRFHGTESTYGGSYATGALKHWARQINNWRADARDVYAYFNNDPEGHAIANATTLRTLVHA